MEGLTAMADLVLQLWCHFCKGHLIGWDVKNWVVAKSTGAPRDVENFTTTNPRLLQNDRPIGTRDRHCTEKLSLPVRFIS